LGQRELLLQGVTLSPERLEVVSVGHTSRLAASGSAC
jgi:hypothetical protein